MRTTLNLDDQLLMTAKHKAFEQGVPLEHIIENALRESFAQSEVTAKTIRLITASGTGVKPGIDLDNGRSLLDVMNDPG